MKCSEGWGGLERGGAGGRPDWVRCTVPARRGHSKLGKARTVTKQEGRQALRRSKVEGVDRRKGAIISICSEHCPQRGLLRR